MKPNLGIISQLRELDRVLSDCALKIELIKDIKHPGVVSISTNFVVLNEMSETIQEDFRAGRINKHDVQKIRFINELKRKSEDLNRIIDMASNDLLSQNT